MEEVLRVQDLYVQYHTSAGIVRAVEGVTFSLKKRERLGLVGESGSGKSTTILALMQMIKPPGRIHSGKVLLHDDDLLTFSEDEIRAARFARISLVPQGAMNSLNPVMRIKHQIGDTIKYHDGTKWSKQQLNEQGRRTAGVGGTRSFGGQYVSP